MARLKAVYLITDEGFTIYNQSFGATEQDQDMVGSLIMALTTFGKEIMSETSLTGVEFGGTDEDFGLRLGKISNMKRKIIGNIYEFNHESQRQKYRDDNILRQICKQSPIPRHIRANLWKPTNNQLKRFENYHKLNDIYLDKNWKEIMNSPLYELEGER